MQTPDRAWRSAVAALGGDPAAASGAAADLGARYAEPHRSYHGTAHVAAVLAAVDELAAAAGLDADATAQVVLAACAHDVVHDGTAGEDERASADWAVAALQDAGLAAHTDRVAELVLVTVAHDPDPADPAAGVLSDADLAVLGGTPEQYSAYVAAVRAEYAHVDAEGWRAGRAAVLRGLLERRPLFATDAARSRWEDAARANLEGEFALLLLAD